MAEIIGNPKLEAQRKELVEASKKGTFAKLKTFSVYEFVYCIAIST